MMGTDRLNTMASDFGTINQVVAEGFPTDGTHSQATAKGKPEDVLQDVYVAVVKCRRELSNRHTYSLSRSEIPPNLKLFCVHYPRKQST